MLFFNGQCRRRVWWALYWPTFYRGFIRVQWSDISPVSVLIWFVFGFRIWAVCALEGNICNSSVAVLEHSSDTAGIEVPSKRSVVHLQFCYSRNGLRARKSFGRFYSNQNTSNLIALNPLRPGTQANVTLV